MPENDDTIQSSHRLSDAERLAFEAYDERGSEIAKIAAEQYRVRAVSHAIPKKPTSYRVAKRLLDILISLGAIIVLAIPGALLSIAVARDTGGSPFYRQTRIGKDGKLFKIIKYRTMVVDADHLEKYFTKTQVDEWVYERKVDNDPRVTKLSAFLRRTSIDELPNFFNSFIGDMSIVGPRAITPEELVWYSGDADLLLSVPAGITGLWQVRSRNNARYETGERQRLELEYVQNASLGLDVKIFFQTFFVVLDGTGS